MRKVLYLLICACAVPVMAVRGEVHIGIVAAEDSAREAADLLAVGLGSVTNVALVERGELDKALRERAFADNQRANITALGQTLHADGLVLLEVINSSAPAKLAIRLVAVNSGVVLDAAIYPYPLPEPARWTELTSARLARLIPKLQVPKDRAIPISILNLHAAVATTESAQTERTLSTLLFHRLALEPDVFVLERRQLGRAEWEKTLALDESEFWSGGCLLEGVIDRDGIHGGAISINAQLTTPDTKQPIDIDVSARRDDIPQLVEQLVRKILVGLRAESKGARWDRAGEAERFEQECSWAARWRMWPEAYAAAESAWALGRHTEPVATVKLKGLIGQTSPEGAWDHDATRNIRFSNPRRQFDPVRNVVWTTKIPSATDVTFAMEAAGTFCGITQSPETSWRQNPAWLDLGTNVLATASGVIRHQYLSGWRQNSFHPDLPLLRKLTRDLASILPAERVRSLLLRLGGYWQDTPGDAIRLYQQALEPDDSNYPFAFARDPYEPFWVGWSPVERENGRRQWNNFIAELQSSTNRLAGAFGALLKLHQAQLDPDIALAQEEFLDTVMDEKRLRFRTDIGFPVLDAFSNVLSNKCANPVTLRRTRLMNSWKAHDFARAKHYLQTARVHDIDRAGWPYAQRYFTQEQARELLPVVHDYIRRIGGDWMSAVRGHVSKLAARETDEFDAFLAVPVFDSARFRRLFLEHQFSEAEAQRLAFPLRLYAGKVGWNEDLRQADARLQEVLQKIRDRSATNAPPSPPATETLTITRRLEPMFKDSRGELLPAKTGKWIEHQGIIITTGEHPSTGAVWPPVSDGPHVIELDLMTGETRMLPQVVSVEKYQEIKFQVIGERFFWIDGNSNIGVLERHSSRINRYAVPLPLWQAELVALDQRLFITSQDFIAEFSLVDHSAMLLASQRRKPAATRLDDWAGWSGKPRLWLGRTGTLFANVGSTNVWALEPASGAWNEWPLSKGHDGFPSTLSYERTFSSCLDECVWIDGARDILLSSDHSHLPRWPMPFDYPLTPGMSMGHRAGHFYDGTNLWLLMSPTKTQVASNKTSIVKLRDRDLTLLWFDPRYEIPASIPIRFAEKDNRAGLVLGQIACISVGNGLIFEPDPMSFGRPTVNSLWFLPWADLLQWVSRHQPPDRRLPRSEPERRRKFDLNHDGLLDEAETKTMNADKGVRKEREQFESQRLFLTFDANNDDKLDAGELERLCWKDYEGNLAGQNSSRGPYHFFGGQMLKPEVLLRSCDLNHDNAISDKEVPDLYRSVCGALTFRPAPSIHRPGARLPASSNVVSKVRPNYDRNGNGRIDPEERHFLMPERWRPYDKNTNGLMEPNEMEEYRTNTMGIMRKSMR